MHHFVTNFVFRAPTACTHRTDHDLDRTDHADHGDHLDHLYPSLPL